MPLRDQDRRVPQPVGQRPKSRPLTEIEKQIEAEREWEPVGTRPGIQRNRRTGMWRNVAKAPP